MLRNKHLKRILAVMTALIILTCCYNTGSNGKNIFATGEESLFGKSDLFFSGKINGTLTGEAKYYRLGSGDAESLVLPATDGIYIVENNELKKFIKTDDVVLEVEAIPDVDGDGINDLAAVVRSDFFPWIRAYSSSTGSMLWSYKNAEPYYDGSDNVAVERNISVSEMDVITDESPDKSYMTLISNYSIICLSIKDGKKIWEYRDRDNIWKICPVGDINDNGYKDVVFGNQLGEIKALDGKNGNLLWRNKIIEDFTVKSERNNRQTLTRSVWDIVLRKYSDKESLLVSGEDGFIYEINISNGDVIKSTDVCKLDEDFLNSYYDKQRDYDYRIVSTGFYYSLFFGLKIFPVEDVTGDNVEDYIATQNLGFSRSYEFLYNFSRNENVEINNYVSLIDGKNLNVLWTADITNETVNVEYTEPIIIKTSDNKQRILLPGQLNQEGLFFIALNPQDGKIIKDNYPLSVKLNIKFSDMEMPSYRYILRKSLKDSVFLGIMDIHSAVLSGNLDKVIAEFDSGHNRSYIKFDDKVLLIQDSSGLSTYISMHDANNLNKIWTYDLGDTGVEGASGIGEIIPSEDFNNDGVSDIMIRIHHDFRKTPNYIFKIISGKDGSEIYSFELKNEGGKIFLPGDVNNDKFIDFLVVRETDCYRMISEARGGAVVYYRDDKVYKYDVLAQNPDYAQLLGDIDGDGVEDFYLNFRENNSAYVSVISGKTMEKLYDIKDYVDEYYYFTKYDFDNDGVPDFIRITPNGSMADVISASQKKTLLSILLNEDFADIHDRFVVPEDKNYVGFFNAFPGNYITPVGDMTGDGNPEYAIVAQVVKDFTSSIELRIYDIAQGNPRPVKIFPIIADDYEYMGNKVLARIMEVKGDNKGKYLLFKLITESFLFDLEKEAQEVSFKSEEIREAFIQNGILTVFGKDYKKIGISYDFEITNLKSGDKAASPLKLKWNNNRNGNFSVTAIYVDKILNAVSYSDGAVLQLKAGRHEIDFKHTDEFGISYYNRINLDVVKSKAPIFFLVFATIAAITLALLLMLVPSIRMKRTLKRRVRKNELPGNIGE